MEGVKGEVMEPVVVLGVGAKEMEREEAAAGEEREVD
jgi:hypothetical protein